MMYITKQDVERILAVMNDFPDAQNYFLERDNSNGIGTTLTLQMDMVLNNHDVTVKVEISGAEDW
jgi:hypothetical protein